MPHDLSPPEPDAPGTLPRPPVATNGQRPRGDPRGRDAAGEARDQAARARDRLAAALDSQTELMLASTDAAPRLAAIEALRRAGRARAAAARDRYLAAQDRRAAERDRARAAELLALQGMDELTGVQRRGPGLRAMQRELNRAQRTGTPTVMAFVDVDGLKRVNDERGHLAGDALLREVGRCLDEQLRSYDPIARVGGDEFLCLLVDQKPDVAAERFRLVSTLLAERCHGATITVGLAQRQEGDALDALVERADASMRAQRRGERA